ncbi:NAD(P)H-dependent oxidoreductase [Chryseomicrobium sp. FSL W7-1435]|uniref:NADPH-dependent FMN reductase n=1 Tax=Chryseomicrobium sp. FSL W7-1435 TaxID=2921704 RepID=UPI00315A1312
MTEKLKVGIILGSTRDGRISPQVGEWLVEKAKQREDADYELVDIKDYDLPFFGTEESEGVKRWNDKLDSLDAFVFVVAEYNHSMTGALKNAFDSAREPWHNKAAGIVSYGSAGGTRAAEHVRQVLAELMIADVRVHPVLSLFLDFEKGETFKPRDLHDKNISDMLDQVLSWGGALKPLRSK